MAARPWPVTGRSAPPGRRRVPSAGRSGIRLLGPIFESDVADTWSFQQALFQFTDIVVTAGLIAGGPAAIHELMALVDDFLKVS